MQFRWHSAAISHPGRVRSVNEDAVLDRAADGLWVLADGMGGHHRGDLASGTIVDHFATLALPDSPEALGTTLGDGLAAINARLVQMARDQAGGDVIGSTVVVLALSGPRALILWAGDSRAYRLRGGRLDQVSEDHSQVQELVRQGLLAADQAENHPAANVVTRAVGAAPTLMPDSAWVALEDNDTFLLCSDGLTKEVPDAEIAGLLRNGRVEDCAQTLIQTALDRGARDNVSVIVVRVEEKTMGY